MRNVRSFVVLALIVLLVGCRAAAPPPQYVVVRFPEQRVVYVDGRPGGVTNQVICLGPGTHTFALEVPADYEPESQRVVIECSPVTEPMEVTFEKR